MSVNKITIPVFTNAHKAIMPVLLLCLYMIGTTSCVKPFNPPSSTADLNYLVVDGAILKGTVSTVRLSRTRNINDSTVDILPEKNAQVFVESRAGELFSFETSQDGVYTAHTESISGSEEYRLRINTADGKEYLSDYVPVKITPEIDSLEWKQDDDVFIYVNTHDPSNNTHYYRWDFVETSEYHAAFDSYLDYQNGEVVYIRFDEYRYACYNYYNSSEILLANSASLSEDVIRHAWIANVPNDLTKISNRYSINVKQYALTPEAYKYWQFMKLNSEQSGKIFDPQPAQLYGNIHSVSDPARPVIGFVSASTVTEKRIFIGPGELKDVPRPVQDPLCMGRTVPANDGPLYLADGLNLPAYYTTRGGLVIAPVHCVDCRVHGGSNVTPSYW